VKNDRNQAEIISKEITGTWVKSTLLHDPRKRSGAVVRKEVKSPCLFLCAGRRANLTGLRIGKGGRCQAPGARRHISQPNKLENHIGNDRQRAERKRQEQEVLRRTFPTEKKHRQYLSVRKRNTETCGGSESGYSSGVS